MSNLLFRSLADKSFFHFVRMVNPPPKDACPVTREIHKVLCDFSQDSTIKRKAICMPRDWLKSTIFTQWKTIWAYLQNNEIRQLLAMENSDLGMKKLNFMQKQIRYNTTLRKLYPELGIVDDKWVRSHRWNKTEMELPCKGIYPEPSVSIIGVGGAAQSGHYDIIRIDDLVGKKAMESPVVMEGVLQWMDNTEELLLEPDITTANASSIEIVGTHWSTADYFSYVQKEYPEFMWKIVPCLKDFDLENQDHIDWIQNAKSEQSESNWPEQFPTDHYLKMKANPQKSFIFWSQHMNNPDRAVEGGLSKFDVKWLKPCYIDTIDGTKYVICKDDNEKFRLKDIPLYGMLDPGGFSEVKLLKRGSRNAMLIGGQPKQTKKKFILYTSAEKFKEPAEYIHKIFQADDEWHPRTWRIDPHGQQPYIYKDILQAKRQGYILKGRQQPAKPEMSISKMEYDTALDAKDKDIQACMNPMASGFIYVLEGKNNLLKGEVKDYPGGLTRDLVDLLGKLNRLYFSREEAPLRKRQGRPRRTYNVYRSTGY